MHLNSDSTVPLYQQLKKAIINDINLGKYKIGDKLPTEFELCEIYSVSRITIRRAIADMVKEGKLQRQRGKGTFIVEKWKNELICVDGFTDYVLKSGKTPNSRIISNSVIPADEIFASLLNVPIGTPLLKLHRLLFIDNLPMMLDTDYYSLERFPYLEQFVGDGTSTYKILREKYPVKFVSMEKTIDIVQASQEEASSLNCELSETLFKIKKTVFDQDGDPIYTSELLSPTSRVTLSISRTTSMLDRDNIVD